MNTALFTIITFYQFKKISVINQFKNELIEVCKFNKIRGTIILAKEGINGTVAGNNRSIKLLISFFKNKGFNDTNQKISYYKFMPFNHLKIRIKNEIVTFKSKNSDPENITGNYVEVKDWNSLIENNNILLLDVRNNFEFKLGTFKHATNPNISSFTEFKSYVAKDLKNKKNTKIAMFCTGGIRCEKASSYMLKRGFKKIYQLKGGILSYLENTSKKQSNWIGECFVFDNRVSLKNEMKEGTYELCHACRYPLGVIEKKSNKFLRGISCPKCYDKLSINKKKSLLERNKQIKISKKRGLYNPYIKITPNDF